MKKARENLRQLVEALRSGKYRQGAGFLRRKYEKENGFCCLGVACDVADPSGWVGRKRGPQWTTYTHQGGMMTPSDDVRAFFGLDDRMVDELVKWNDRDRLTFDQIAERIEQYLDNGSWWG